MFPEQAYTLSYSIKRFIMVTPEQIQIQKSSSSTEMNTERGNSMLEKLFIDSLKDIYWAEKHLTTVLARMQKAATTAKLKSAFGEHIIQTDGHIKRLEQVFEFFNKPAVAKKCEAMEGLTNEGDTLVEETEEGSMTRDAAMIMAAQKVEHYEIATYGSLVHFAKTLGLNEVAGTLQLTLDEEKKTDQELTLIAESSINWNAVKEPLKQKAPTSLN